MVHLFFQPQPYLVIKTSAVGKNDIAICPVFDAQVSDVSMDELHLCHSSLSSSSWVHNTTVSLTFRSSSGQEKREGAPHLFLPLELS